MNILVVSHIFPPLNYIGAQRPYSWAKHWSRLGHSVCVLTTKKELFDGPIDPHFNAQYIPLVNIEEVSAWPSSNKKTSKLKDSFFKKKSSTNFLRDKLQPLSKQIRQYLGMGAVFSIRNLWINPAIKHGIALHEKYRFDCIVSSYGPPASHLVASQLKKKINIPWIADYRDLWYGSHYKDAEGIFAFIQKTIEDSAVSKADLLTTVSEPLNRQLEARFNKETLTIENGFDVDNLLDRDKNQNQKKSSKVTIVYTGTIYGNQQCIEPFFQAIHTINLQSTHLDQQLEVLFYSNVLGEVPKLINKYKLHKIVKVAGFVNRSDSLRIQHEADALLFLDWKDTSVDGILSGKIFEYLYSGTPILGIGSYNTLAPGKLILESGCGICLEDSPKAIQSALMQLLSGQQLPYNLKPEILERYSREKLAEKMLHHILKLVDR